MRDDMAGFFFVIPRQHPVIKSDCQLGDLEFVVPGTGYVFDEMGQAIAEESRRAALQEHVQSDASALAVDIDRLDQEVSKSGLEDGSAPVKEAHAAITKYHEDAEALRTAAKRCAASGASRSSSSRQWSRLSTPPASR